MCTNALTPFLYKKEFKTGIMADIGKIQKIQTRVTKVVSDGHKEGKTEEQIAEELGETMMAELDDLMEVSLRIAYALIKTANSAFMPFENWLETITEFDINDSWVSEVTELAVNTFCGQGTRGTTGVN